MLHILINLKLYYYKKKEVVEERYRQKFLWPLFELFR